MRQSVGMSTSAPMYCLLVRLISAIAIAGGQTIQTPVPPKIVVQPTDLLTVGSSNGLNIIPLATKVFAVEEKIMPVGSTAVTSLQIPCRAEGNPQAFKYYWYKWDSQRASWQALTNTAITSWSVLLNGDQTNAGMLSINPYNKIVNSGAYICHVVAEDTPVRTIALSKVLNLTAVNFIAAGVQASLMQRPVKVGDYVKLDGVIPSAYPMITATWARTATSAVPSGQAREIPPDRVLMDEFNNLHIPYFDNSLIKFSDASGLNPANFYHLKCMSLKYIMTDLAVVQLTITSESPPTTAECTLQYQTPKLNLVRGANSRIACVFSGAPSIKVTYFKLDASGKYQPLNTLIMSNGDAEIAMSNTGVYGNIYVIGSAQPSDSGTYTCSATYVGGACTAQIQPIVVTVNTEPEFVMQPRPVEYVVEGQAITLEWHIRGCTSGSTEVGQNGDTPLPISADKLLSSVKDIFSSTENITLRTITLLKAIKPIDTRSLQVYATNHYYTAISNVALTVISPITFMTKAANQLELQRGAKALFSCVAYGDDALPLFMNWYRFFGGVTYSIVDSGSGGQFSISTNDVVSPTGLKSISQTLTVDTSQKADLDDSRGQYICNASNAVTWNVSFARLSFYGDDPVAAASFQLWMLGPILGGVAAIIFVVGIIWAVRHNRGEKYEVEDEEIKKGFDPKREAHEQREMQEYQRDREKSCEPLTLDSQMQDEIEEDIEQV